jgi:hypothetical protein
LLTNHPKNNIKSRKNENLANETSLLIILLLSAGQCTPQLVHSGYSQCACAEIDTLKKAGKIVRTLNQFAELGLDPDSVHLQLLASVHLNKGIHFFSIWQLALEIRIVIATLFIFIFRYKVYS